jgi:hypothetical protein
VNIPSFQNFLKDWPYDAENNIRIAFGADGREVILVRLPMGLEQYEMDDRPDGRHVRGIKSAFDYYSAGINLAMSAGVTNSFDLGTEACAELFKEGLLFQHRVMLLVRLKDWARVERDTARNLRLVYFIRHHARHEEDRERISEWRPEITRINNTARAMILLEQCRYQEALQIARDVIGLKNLLTETETDCGKLVSALQGSLHESTANHPAPESHEESLFLRHSDYWTIRHRGHTTCLKATRGLHCLAFLLRHPGREFHVSELLASLVDPHTSVEVVTVRSNDGLAAVGLYDGCPRLDSQAKIEYRRRLDELREDLHEAKQFNDPLRAAKTQEEMNAITEHFASAIGLGGRDRKTSSEAERARSAVTKRIKQSVQKIAESIPDLGQHLAVSIKTGYFCSYAPHPDQPVAWRL